MSSAIISFLVMLNPFALFLYLNPIMKDLKSKDFYWVLMRASFISLIIYSVFLLIGESLFQDIIQIEFDSFRIFGGIVIFSLAYLYIVMGRKAMIQMRGDLDDLASEIALPFMVGAGTISLTILYRQQFKLVKAFGIVTLSLVLNYIFIFLMKKFKDLITSEKYKVAFDKNIGTLLRLNGFLVGAIGVDMVIGSLKAIYISLVKG